QFFKTVWCWLVFRPVDYGYLGISVEEGGHCFPARLERPEYGCEVACYCPAPAADIFFRNGLSSFMRQKVFHELYGGCDITYFGIYPSALCPGRRDDKGYAVPQAYGAFGSILFFDAIGYFLLPGDIFAAIIETGRCSSRIWIARFGCHEWRNMIEIAVVFVVVQNKNGFLPNLRIFGQYI